VCGLGGVKRIERGVLLELVFEEGREWTGAGFPGTEAVYDRMTQVCGDCSCVVLLLEF
jgi:hypothetical protein